MEWEEYRQSYRNGSISISIDKSLAMLLMDNKNKFVHTMFKGRRYAYLFGMYLFISCFWIGFIGGIAWFFVDYYSGWIPLVALAVSVIISNGTKKSACQFIIEETLENKEYYDMLRYEEVTFGADILQIRKLE